MAKHIYRDYVTTTDAVWTVKLLCDYADQGIVVFDNAVQREYVWSTKDNSLLIHSVIVNLMPPEFLANKKDGIYDIIDGKQRHNALSRYLKDEYSLVNVPNLIATDGTEYELNGKLFSELPEEIQDKITGRGLKISVMDDASQKIVKEYFYRRNAGVQLTMARKTFSQAASFDEISGMAKHPLFKEMFKKNVSDGSNGVVMRSYVLLNCEMKSLDSRKVSSYIKRAKFSQDAVSEILACYDRILEAYKIIVSSDSKDNKKIGKTMLKVTHMLTLVTVAKYANEKGIGSKPFANWILNFFAINDSVGATISVVYNENTSTGTGKEPAVRARMKAMVDDFITFTEG